MKFSLEFNIDGGQFWADGVRDNGEGIADALIAVGKRINTRGIDAVMTGDDSRGSFGTIRDDNGNTIGKFRITE